MTSALAFFQQHGLQIGRVVAEEIGQFQTLEEIWEQHDYATLMLNCLGKIEWGNYRIGLRQFVLCCMDYLKISFIDYCVYPYLAKFTYALAEYFADLISFRRLFDYASTVNLEISKRIYGKVSVAERHFLLAVQGFFCSLESEEISLAGQTVYLGTSLFRHTGSVGVFMPILRSSLGNPFQKK